MTLKIPAAWTLLHLHNLFVSPGKLNALTSKDTAGSLHISWECWPYKWATNSWDFHVLQNNLIGGFPVVFTWIENMSCWSCFLFPSQQIWKAPQAAFSKTAPVCWCHKAALFPICFEFQYKCICGLNTSVLLFFQWFLLEGCQAHL